MVSSCKLYITNGDSEGIYEQEREEVIAKLKECIQLNEVSLNYIKNHTLSLTVLAWGTREHFHRLLCLPPLFPLSLLCVYLSHHLLFLCVSETYDFCLGVRGCMFVPNLFLRVVLGLSG